MKIKPHILFSVISFYFLLNTLHVSSAKKSDTDAYLLSCGSTSAESDADGRKWEPDTKFLVSPNKPNPYQAQYQDPSLPSTVPYMTAMVFDSETTYSFPITTKDRYWVRLHFYPTTYSNLNASDAYFSVLGGGITLLKNFSAAITAQALTQVVIVREFSLLVTTNVLNVTFTPSNEHKGSFAFVNGIEVISMPKIFKEPATFVGLTDQSIDSSTSSMQTMYRLNVGGQFIPGTNDSGLTRTWYDDTPYLFGGAAGVTIETDKNDMIKYPTTVPEYIAPGDVYSTARSMGPSPKVNRNYNLTWSFTVDANFTYIIRLHFCEVVWSKVNQRVFDIYINNQTAQDGADVIAWAGAKDVPYYKDFAIFISGEMGDEQLWVALHPSYESKPEVFDAILNGLEIFKTNDTAGNLAGPNPVPSDMLLEAESVDASNPDLSFTEKHGKAIGGAAGGAAAVGLVAAFCIVVYSRKRRELGSDSGMSSFWLPLYGNSTTSSSGKSCRSSTIPSLGQGLCRHFSLVEIKRGTRNFDESHVIGVGGFGKVYRGVVDGGLKVAIKRSNPSSEQGVHEFRTEIEMLSKLRHRHLVSLIGFCEESDEMILVYDYMAYGTLREHLYNKSSKLPNLSWKQRLEICIGAARGLHYLHTGAKYTIIHRDVKTTNILLDENWVAKVSDFGLSKTGPTLNESHVSTVVKGSFGYLDPEYFRRQQLTDKSDVYSFGVVLFEVLCARPALNPSLPKEQVSLADYARICQRKGTLGDIIDPHLKGKIRPEGLKKFADTAEKCLLDHGTDRPSMGDVLWNLEFALQLEENGESGSGFPVETNTIKHTSNSSLGGGESVLVTGPEAGGANSDFSLLSNMTGR